jgi:soluble lytic murein transglycosylase
LIRDAALAHDLQASWIWGPMRQESGFNPRAHSSSDARGLIQIMPETGRFIAAQRGWDTFDPELLWDPEFNIDFGSWYIAYLRDQVGGDRLLDVLAAYNGGPGRLGRWRDQLPTRDDDIFVSAIPAEETRNFAHWVYENVRMYDMVLEEEGFELVPF